MAHKVAGKAWTWQIHRFLSQPYPANDTKAKLVWVQANESFMYIAHHPPLTKLLHKDFHALEELYPRYVFLKFHSRAFDAVADMLLRTCLLARERELKVLRFVVIHRQQSSNNWRFPRFGSMLSK